MTPRDRWLVGGVLGYVVLVWFVFEFWYRPPVIVPPVLHIINDSLRRTKQADQFLIDSLRTAGLVQSAQGARAASRARASEARAASIGARADAAASRARSGDSTASDSLATAWHLAYDLRTAERDTLLTALASKDSAYRAASVSANDFRLAVVASDTRRVAVEGLNDGLIKALEKAERGCRILWSVPCPSRTVSAVLGATAVSVAVVVVQTRRP